MSFSLCISAPFILFYRRIGLLIRDGLSKFMTSGVIPASGGRFAAFYLIWPSFSSLRHLPWFSMLLTLKRFWHSFLFLLFTCPSPRNKIKESRGLGLKSLHPRWCSPERIDYQKKILHSVLMKRFTYSTQSLMICKSCAHQGPLSLSRCNRHHQKKTPGA